MKNKNNVSEIVKEVGVRLPKNFEKEMHQYDVYAYNYMTPVPNIIRNHLENLRDTYGQDYVDNVLKRIMDKDRGVA